MSECVAQQGSGGGQGEMGGQLSILGTSGVTGVWGRVVEMCGAPWPASVSPC